MKKQTLAVVVSSTLGLKLHLNEIINNLKQHYTVIILTDLSKNQTISQELPQDVEYIDCKIQRKINLFSDIRTVFLLLKYLKKKRVSIVYTLTPKAGLLGILASKFLGIPIRIHNFTGQVWFTEKGLFKTMLIAIDKLIYKLATTIIIDSNSQRQFLINKNIINEERSIVLGHGSFRGVDIKLFSPNPVNRELIRKRLHVNSNCIVFIFLGRIHRDKGIEDLLKAYAEINKKLDNTSLWLVGPIEMEKKLLDDLIEKCHPNSVKLLPYTDNPEIYLSSADIFCLPSYREGFGSVIIEAASCGIPSIATRIYGLSDAIIDGETGLLVDAKDHLSLGSKMLELALDKKLRKKLGNSAQKRAHTIFNQKKVIQNLLDFLDNQVKNANL